MFCYNISLFYCIILTHSSFLPPFVVPNRGYDIDDDDIDDDDIDDDDIDDDNFKNQ